MLSFYSQFWLTITFSLGTFAQTSDPLFCAGGNGNLAPPQTNLTQVQTASFDLPARPWGLVYATLQKNIAFITLRYTSNSTLGVLNVSTSTITLIHEVNLPNSYTSLAGPGQIALSHDGTFLVVSAGPGGIIIDTTLATNGSPNAVVGLLNGTTTSANPGDESLDVTLSPNDKFASFAQEFRQDQGNPYGDIDVVKITKIPSYNSTPSFSGTPIGDLTLGIGVIGSALSQDGDYLYVVSEQASSSIQQGGLSVLNVTTLQSTPSAALISNLTAGCGLVRVVVSPDGSTVWTTSRQDNTLLGFSAAKLISDPSAALLANVTVGTSPVSLIFVGENRILTTNSNRFGIANATTGISVVDVNAALEGKGRGSVLGEISTGTFPRELALSPDGGTVLVSDYGSNQVQRIEVGSLP